MHPLHRTRSTLRTLALSALAAVAACGGDSTGPDDGEEGGTGTLLASGTPMTGRSGDEGSITIYRITVPSGATNLLVTTSGGSGDLDLYLRAGEVPTESAVDCESAGADNDESCAVPDPAAGTWYIALFGYEAYSGATLTATVTGGTSGGDGPGDGGGTPVTWASVTMGATHACGLSVAGKAYCWGSRVSGETGDGDPVEGSDIRFNNRVPYPVAGNHTFAQLSAGSSHTCGVTTAGALYCWGSNSSGQIGDGGPTGGSSGAHWRNVPVAIASGTTFSNVSAGGGFTCAVTSGGATWCWGYNDSELATGGWVGTNTIMTPEDAGIGFPLAEVYAGGVAAACGRTPDSDLYCWGNDSWGLLGDGPTQTPVNSGPQQVVGGPYETASVGSMSACAISADGGLWCWGQNHENQLGYAASGDYHNDYSGSPVRIAGDEAWTDVAVGGGFGCALTNAGAAHCWGLNASGQTGIGSYTPRNPLPTPVAGGHVFASLASNSDGSSMCGVTTGGAIWCWGYNTSWQLGTTHSSISTPTPVQVEPAI